MRQERARQTRQALLQAAATEFDRHGYAGTSLARVSQTAGVTMGALTFHFPSKAALADAVRTQAAALTRAAVPETADGGGRCDESVGGLIDTLTQLLDEEPSVRAAARLSWEQPESAGNWHTAWSPGLRDRLARERSTAATDTTAHPDDTGPDRAGPDRADPDDADLDDADLETLMHCLVAGSAALRRGTAPMGDTGPATPEEIRQRLQRLWRRAVAGPATPGPAAPGAAR
ncbi:TetR family transcriptional regulator [Kitasatospora misakiensis]|uniref:TetR family transcriptional regulator n=1 Tax=Kitasatospora misakiensis TaxID=67330 RepID=A0ABW0X5N0_9ACTN